MEQVKRRILNPQKQLDALDERYGMGQGAEKERARLARLILSTSDVVPTVSRKQKKHEKITDDIIAA